VNKNAEVLGFNIFYREEGSGSPVVLLHGLGGDGSRWGPNIRPLAEHFRVIVPDQIGFGQSDKPLANYHCGMLAEFLARFMKAIEVPKASLVGNSMGAWVAIYFAVHYPQMLDRLVLVDGGAYRSSGQPVIARDPQLRRIQNGVTTEETRAFFEMMFYDKRFVTDRVVEEGFAARLRCAYTIAKMQEASDNGLGSVTEEQVRAVKASTLIVWGKHDRIVDPSVADRLHAAIPGSQKVIIGNAGHLPQLEQFAEFNRIVREFLKADHSPEHR
jgi:pimeloyl-ACP methyl ester carboxylesterase